MYRLIYPTDAVPLADIARAALAECGPDHVTVVSGFGSQVVRVPEACADRVEVAVGLAEPPAPDAPAETAEDDPGAASAPVTPPPGTGAPTPPQKPNETRRGNRRSKEG